MPRMHELVRQPPTWTTIKTIDPDYRCVPEYSATKYHMPQLWRILWLRIKTVPYYKGTCTVSDQTLESLENLGA